MYCSEECMYSDRVDHSLECKRVLHEQVTSGGRPLIESRVLQRNMSKPHNGGPKLLANLLAELTAAEREKNIVFVPLPFDKSVLLGPKSPVLLLEKPLVVKAMGQSNALKQACEWYLRHQRDRRGESFLYVCIYSPDVAFAEMIALPSDDTESASDKLEHIQCQCQCSVHRGS